MGPTQMWVLVLHQLLDVLSYPATERAVHMHRWLGDTEMCHTLGELQRYRLRRERIGVGTIEAAGGVGLYKEGREHVGDHGERLIVTYEVAARLGCQIHVERPGDMLLAPMHRVA